MTFRHTNRRRRVIFIRANYDTKRRLSTRRLQLLSNRHANFIRRRLHSTTGIFRRILYFSGRTNYNRTSNSNSMYRQYNSRRQTKHNRRRRLNRSHQRPKRHPYSTNGRRQRRNGKRDRTINNFCRNQTQLLHKNRRLRSTLMLQVNNRLNNARNRYDQTIRHTKRRTNTNRRFAQRQLAISVTRIRHNHTKRRLTIGQRDFTQRRRRCITRLRLLSQRHIRSIHNNHDQDQTRAPRTVK